MDKTFKKAENILARNRKKWLALENVVSAGIGRTDKGDICILVLLARDNNSIRRMIPGEIDGIPIEVRVSGKIDVF